MRADRPPVSNDRPFPPRHPLSLRIISSPSGLVIEMVCKDLDTGEGHGCGWAANLGSTPRAADVGAAVVEHANQVVSPNVQVVHPGREPAP